MIYDITEPMDEFQLSDNFGVRDMITFAENEDGLMRMVINTTACSAELYLQGAHLTHWQPAGHEPVLFLSERSAFVPEKAIRGGIPIIFPWFGPRTANTLSDRTDGPSHGFARTSLWRITSCTVITDEVYLTLELPPSEKTAALGFPKFEIKYGLILGKTLEAHLSVKNTSDKPFYFEEALHTYFSVGNVHQTGLYGLAGIEYLDKVDGMKRKTQSEDVLVLSGETDRPYVNTQAEVGIQDDSLKRLISVEKKNSNTTVIWNPWSELTAKMADMAPDDWQKMVCVEAANAGENGITLAPGATHVMQIKIFADK